MGITDIFRASKIKDENTKLKEILDEIGATEAIEVKERIEQLKKEEQEWKNKKNQVIEQIKQTEIDLSNKKKQNQDEFKKLESESKDENEKEYFSNLAKMCLKVPLNPASSFHEALQTIWFTHIATQIDDVSNHSLGRLDQYLYPYYIEDIKKGFAGNSFKIIENRRDAIYEAVQMAQENDVLLVAGKGHEDYQIIGSKVFQFSDREVIEESL